MVALAEADPSLKDRHDLAAGGIAPGAGPPVPVVLHDDPVREFDYVAGAEDALERSWTVVSIKADWVTVFPQT